MNIKKTFFQFDLENLEFHASCSEGLSSFLIEEAQDFSLKVLSSNRGGIFFQGKKENLLRFFLSTRFSSRISFTLYRMKVESADDLYKKAILLPWEKILPPEISMKIESFTKDNLSHSKYALYRLKDAIKDKIRKQQKREILIDTENPNLLFLLRSFQDEVIIQISLTSKSLHKRGYRIQSLEAPIRESLAQALLYFSDWNLDTLLIDPMCGSGTIAIEAALLLRTQGNVNYELLKQSFVFRNLFPNYKIDFKNSLITPKIYGFDIDPKAIELAKLNAERAGVLNLIHFEQKDFLSLSANQFSSQGTIVTNPPYGVRISNKEEIKSLYTKIGENLKKNFTGYSFNVICGDKSLLGYFRLKAEKEKSISIARLKGKFVQYKIL